MADKEFDIDDYSNAIAPDGEYSFYSPKTGAVGKYKFSWGAHEKDIKKVTGVKDRNEFLNSPAAQDKYFSWHVVHNLKPAIARLSPLNKSGLDEAAMANLIHSKGEGGAKRWLSENQKNTSAEQPQQPDADAPISTEERNKWEAMKSALFQQYNDWGPAASHNDLPSEETMRQFGIDPARVPAYQRDFATRKAIQDAGGPHTVMEGNPDYPATNPEFGVNANQQRYTHYVSQFDGGAPIDFGTDRDAWARAEQKHREEVIAREFNGFDDPTKDVNYVPPDQRDAGVYGFPGAGHASGEPQVSVAPDPNFPTRDPITGRVTPAVNRPGIKVSEDNGDGSGVSSDYSTQRRILNGIFGNVNNEE